MPALREDTVCISCLHPVSVFSRLEWPFVSLVSGLSMAGWAGGSRGWGGGGGGVVRRDQALQVGSAVMLVLLRPVQVQRGAVLCDAEHVGVHIWF